MTKETVVFKALVAHHRVEIRHRHFNGRNEFALSITGGRWQYHSFFSPSRVLTLYFCEWGGLNVFRFNIFDASGEEDYNLKFGE